LLADGARCSQLGRAGRDFVARRFEWSIVAEPMLAAYQAALDAQTRAQSIATLKRGELEGGRSL
jgi:hypothetical protein